MPALTADVLLLWEEEDSRKILLIKRGDKPFVNQWALPGGFMEIDETLDQAAARELKEETGLENLALKQFGVFDKPGRDPRGRTVSVAYFSSIRKLQQKPKAASDASETEWFDIDNLPELAFDHAEIIARARKIFKF